MDLFSYRDDKRIITFAKWVDDGVGVPIEYNSSIVAYYVDDGYGVISVPMRPVRGLSDRFLFYVANCLIVLNEDKSIQDLAGFLFYYMKEFNPLENYIPDLAYCEGLINRCYETADEQMVMTTRKFNFVVNVSADVRRKLIMGYLNNRKSSDTLNKIENTIEWLIIASDKFITVNEVVENYGESISPSTVKRYLSVYKDRIDSHNRKVFGTDNFVYYKKMLSIHKIKNAIHLLNEAEERLSRRKVADKAGVHFNTVQNLWDEEEIQEQLDKYNELIK